METRQIDQLCDVVAIRYGIPLKWVRHHVDQKAGRPCHRCGGSGRWGRYGSCFRCQGTGGRGQRSQVEHALQWVEENIHQVKTLGFRREDSRAKREDQKVERNAEKLRQWKEDHPKHWWALQNMGKSEFRTSLINQLESGKTFSPKQMDILREQASTLEGFDTWKKDHPRHWWALENMETSQHRDYLMSRLTRFGQLPEKQMLGLWVKAEQLENALQDRVVYAPNKGTKASWKVRITDASWGDNHWRENVYKVTFTADEGWYGHFETRSAKVEELLTNRTTNQATLTAAVKWSKNERAILGGHVKVELG